MIVIPSLAIDADVRWLQGRIDDLSWMGFQRLQISVRQSDFSSRGRRDLEDLLRDAPCPIQVAGHFTSGDDIDSVLDAGAELAVLGSRALDEPEWLRGVVGQFPNQLLVRAPARERRVRTRGLVRSVPMDLRDLAQELDGLRIAGLIVRFAPDTAIEHSDLSTIEDVTESVDYPVQVSGTDLGLSTLRDLEFRGVDATLMDSASMAGALDEPSLARTFVD
jgi:phosphoribosylformimino-5-aminoimidazole carboxamide ribonucleotide (ProFAR) isomerase